MLLLRALDPVIADDAVGEGVELIGDPFDIGVIPLGDLQEGMSPHTIEHSFDNRPNPVNLLQIVLGMTGFVGRLGGGRVRCRRTGLA